jgi:copper homeostasis protein (lipoprotein)
MAALRAPFRLACLALALAVAGCQKQQAAAPEAKQSQDRNSGEIADFGGERTWQGVLPCADCQGIDTRLVLKQKGRERRYLLEETYLGASEPNRFEREGAWIEEKPGGDAAPTVYVLDPDRAPRRFRLEPDGGVELLTGGAGAAPAPEYRLQRL